jgi:hypothetical protein
LETSKKKTLNDPDKISEENFKIHKQIVGEFALNFKLTQGYTNQLCGTTGPCIGVWVGPISISQPKF